MPATGPRSVRAGGESRTDWLTVFWSETSDPASPPVRGSGLQSTVVHLRLPGRHSDWQQPARLQTNIHKSADNLGTTDLTDVNTLQIPPRVRLVDGCRQRRDEVWGSTFCLLTREDVSQVFSNSSKIFVIPLFALWTKHLLYSNEKSYWEVHVVETEKRDVLRCSM